MNDDQLFLASAYVDGELTADERRLAEADPVVMAQVAEFRALRDDVADAPPAPDAAREAAIGAAMAVFRDTSAPTGGASSGVPTPAASSAPIPFRPRPAYAKYLGVAAALLAVVGLGVVIAQTDFPDGDDDSAADAPLEDAGEDDARLTEAQDDTAGDDAGDEALDMAEAEDGEDTANDDGGAEVSNVAPADGDDTGEATGDMADDVESDMAADGDTAEGTAEDTGEMSEEATGDAGGAIANTVPATALDRAVVPDDFDPETVIVDREALVVLGAYLIDQRDDGTLPPTPLTSCDFPDVLSRATVIIDEQFMDALIAVDEAANAVYAIDEERCVELELDGRPAAP